MFLSQQKYNYLAKISDSNGVISALAFDQRGALKCLMAQYQMKEPTVAQMEELKHNQSFARLFSGLVY